METKVYRFKCAECGKWFFVNTSMCSGEVMVICSHCNFVQVVTLNPDLDLSLKEELRRIAEEKKREEEEEETMGAMCYCPLPPPRNDSM